MAGQILPEWQEALSANFDYQMSNVYTSIPGVVVSVENQGELRVNVQPAVNMRSQDGLLVQSRPPILNVPVQMPSGKQGGLTFPVEAGDPVLLHFTMRGLDVWKMSNGYPTTPSDIRKFDVRDCIAVPGVTPFSESNNLPSKHTLSHSPDDVVLVHNKGSGSEVEIRLKKGGGVEINAPNQQVTVNCQESTVNADVGVTLDTPQTTLTGNLTVEGTLTIDGEAGSGTNTIRGNFNIIGTTLNHNGKDIGSTHTHSGVQTGSGNSGTPN